jgi:hypothetical protein
MQATPLDSAQIKNALSAMMASLASVMLTMPKVLSAAHLIIIRLQLLLPARRANNRLHK